MRSCGIWAARRSGRTPVADFLHRRRGAAVQREGPPHVQPLRPPDEGVRLRPKGGAEHRRPAAAGQMALQVLPGQEQAVFQPDAPTPRKSVTAILGVAQGEIAQQKGSCLGCPAQGSCQYRKAGGHCGIS